MKVISASSKAVGGRLQVEINLKGDLPGHPFRGNQWEGGEGGQGGKTELENRIRHELSDPEGRDFPYQKYRLAKIPDEWKLIESKVKTGIPTGESRSCYNTSLEKVKQDNSLRLFSGVIIEKSDLGSKDKPWAVEHAWTEKDGKIHDFTLGTKKAKDFYYIGIELDPGKFETALDLANYVTGSIVRPRSE